MIHIYPVDEEKEHELEGTMCKCSPEVEFTNPETGKANPEGLVVHNQIYKPFEVLGPSDSIQKEMRFHKLKIDDLSLCLNLSFRDTIKLLRNQLPITQEIAECLGRMFGQSPVFWLNLDKNYRKKEVPE